MPDWQKARVIANVPAADDIRSLVVAPSEWVPHRAGQHYELRIPGTDISRKYSVVSTPYDAGRLEFGVQLLANGALSPRLWALAPGDALEIRGPWGESFLWDAQSGGTPVLIGAGSGITPLLCIYDTCRAARPSAKPIFIMSAKDKGRIMHYEKLEDILVTRFTAEAGRIDADFLRTHVVDAAPGPDASCYVCGPDTFIDSVVDDLLDLGLPPDRIRSEKFD